VWGVCDRRAAARRAAPRTVYYKETVRGVEWTPGGLFPPADRVAGFRARAQGRAAHGRARGPPSRALRVTRAEACAVDQRPGGPTLALGSVAARLSASRISSTRPTGGGTASPRNRIDARTGGAARTGGTSASFIGTPGRRARSLAVSSAPHASVPGGLTAGGAPRCFATREGQA